MTIFKTEKLLKTKYYQYKNGNNYVNRIDYNSNYHIPYYLVKHIDFISPTKRFPSINKLIVNDIEVGANTNTPTVLKELYNVGNVVGGNTDNIQGVASFLEQYYKTSDLNTFWKDYNIDASNVVNVPSDTKEGTGVEAELDVQYLTSMGEKINTQVWYTAGRAPNNIENEPFLTWLLNVENSTNPPNIFSVSYGETETSVGLSYSTRINNEFIKLGTQGISFLFASGDSGAGGNCTHSNGQETPNFPTGSPYVTSIGGLTGINPEQAWISGGGGFSNYWGLQSWQQNAVEYYLNNANGLPDGKFNKSGRAYPDISCQATDYTIVVNGNKIVGSGTSCSTPCVSGIFSLLNDLRLQNGMKPLGFLNPFIYEIAAKDSTTFNDCVNGYNSGCGGKGFPAVPKWDAASGWGSPNYQVLAKYVLQTGYKTKKFVKN